MQKVIPIEMAEDGLVVAFRDGEVAVQTHIAKRDLPDFIAGGSSLATIVSMMQTAVLRHKDEPNWAAEEPEVATLVNRLKDATATPGDMKRLDEIWERRLEAIGA